MPVQLVGQLCQTSGEHHGARGDRRGASWVVGLGRGATVVVRRVARVTKLEHTNTNTAVGSIGVGSFLRPRTLGQWERRQPAADSLRTRHELLCVRSGRRLTLHHHNDDIRHWAESVLTVHALTDATAGRDEVRVPEAARVGRAGAGSRVRIAHLRVAARHRVHHRPQTRTVCITGSRALVLVETTALIARIGLGTIDIPTAVRVLSARGNV